MNKTKVFTLILILLLSVFVLAFTAGTVYSQKKSVAVVPTLGKAVNEEIKYAIQGALEEGIHKSGNYKLLARGAGFQQALKEITFQQESGAVDDEQLKTFGHAAGADFVCYAQINKFSDTYYRITYKLVNVESGEIPVVDSKSVRNGIDGLMDAIDAIAKEMFGAGGGQYGSGGNSSTSNARRHPAEPEMVEVRGGTFWMGCSQEQQGSCKDNESPLHSVTVSSFHIGKYEITQAQWKLIMGTTIRQQRDKEDPSHPISGEGDDYPMYYVSWDEAQEFISRLNEATGKNYRLPTEAEWEYAARGGARSQGYKYSGSNNLYDVAWFKDNSGDKTHPVGTKKANELGVYDMSGNVWEWCWDRFGSYSASPQQNPMGADSGSDRVLRGGSWSHNAFYCRVAIRGYSSPGYRSYLFGFRVVLP